MRVQGRRQTGGSAYRRRADGPTARLEACENGVPAHPRIHEAPAVDPEVFLRGVAHDLRSPLNGIVLAASALETLAESGKLREPRPLVRAIQHEAMRMNRLIDDLLDVSRVDRGALDLEPVEVRPEDLVRDVIEACRFACEWQGVKLIAHVEERLPPVRVDPARIQRILANLIENATRYSQRDGVIEVEAQPAAECVRFLVIDHGSGMAGEDLSLLFQPFRRGHNARGPGSGLGLSIAHDIVVAHGGSIGFRETAGGGSTFCFTVPSVGDPV